MLVRDRWNNRNVRGPNIYVQRVAYFSAWPRRWVPNAIGNLQTENIGFCPFRHSFTYLCWKLTYSCRCHSRKHSKLDYPARLAVLPGWRLFWGWLFHLNEKGSEPAAWILWSHLFYCPYLNIHTLFVSTKTFKFSLLTSPPAQLTYLPSYCRCICLSLIPSS